MCRRAEVERKKIADLAEQAAKHDGIATEVLYQAFFASSNPVGEDRISKVAACALIAKTLADLRDGAEASLKLAGLRKV